MGYSKEAREMLALAKKINKAVKDHPGDSGAIADAVDIAIRLEEFMPVKAHEFSKAARQYAARKVLDAGYDTQAYLAYRRSLLFDAKTDFDSFAQYIEIDRAPERRFYLPRRHYLKPMIAGYQDILDRKLRLLTVSQPKRTGKALTLDTELVTPTGSIKMRDVKVGTLLIGADGKPTKVTDIFPQGRIPVYEVRFSDGTSVKTCENHLWEVKWHDVNKRGGQQQYYTRIVSTGEMCKDKLKSKTHRVYSIRHCKPVEYEKQNFKLHPYIMGALIGDGCLRDSTPMFTSFDREIVERISKLLPKSDKINCQDLSRGRYLITTANGVKNGGHVSSATVTALREYGVYGKLAYDKSIPEEYLYSSVDDRLELVRGLFDTDACASKCHVEFSTVSKKLAKQVQFLVRSLGGSSNIAERMGKYKKGTRTIETCINYRVSARFPEGITPFYLPRKKDKYRPVRKELYHYIDAIIPCGEEEAQCICVDNADHLFLVDNCFIPTHNSQTEILFTLLISGRKPENSTLMEGAGDALVNSFYQGLLEYLAEGSEYLFYDVFPEAKIVQTNADIKIINLKTKSRFPTVMCRSIDATQVGLSEATNALVLDDCVTGREEAMNQKRLDEKWNILRGDVIGRAIEGTPIIATGTRYSLNDPIGKLQDEATRLGWNYRAIEIPALDPVTDESNYEYIRDGKKVFTTEFFREQRSFLSAEQWESEFQQRPIEVKGMLFPRDSLKRYIGLPVREPDAKITVCDPAESGSDFTCQLCLYIYGEDVYVTDVVYDSSVPSITKPECAKMIISHNIPQAVFESNSAGAYFGRDVGEIVKNAHVKTNIKLQLTTRNKETKIELASDGILKYFYFKDDSEIKHGSQYALFLRDLTRYVRGGKIDHDDAADCCAMCENEVRKLNFQNIRVADRIF